jgi:glycosyltransferase involved in cell wall biosynthesis
MSSTAPTSSIVIPVYNEAESLDELVAPVDAATSSLGTSCEIVFVDDGSTDGSFRKLQALDIRRPLHFFGRIGSALFAIGFAALGYLTYPWLRSIPIGSRPLLSLGGLLILIGGQIGRTRVRLTAGHRFVQEGR